MLLTVYRAALLLVGATAFYIALFLHEDEEGRIHDRLERLWVAIDDRRHTTGSKATAVFNKVGEAVSKAFDRVLGKRLFSVQMLGVSTSLALAGFFLACGFLFGFLLRRLYGLPTLPSNLPASITASLLLITMFCLVIGFVLLVIASLPSLLPSQLARFVSTTPAVLTIYAAIRSLQQHKHMGHLLIILTALAVSTAVDIGLLVLVRRSIRWISNAVQPPLSMFAIAFSHLLVALMVLWLPVHASGVIALRYGWKLPSEFLIALGCFNIFTALAASAFTLTLVAVLVHRLFWPFTERLFYQVVRYRVVRNHTAMASLGAACCVLAFPSIRGLAMGILGWLITIFSAKS